MILLDVLKSMRIFIANDHRGYKLAVGLSKELGKQGHIVQHLGCNSTDSCDYPDFAKLLGERVAKETKGLGSDESGVLGIGICGSGVGIAIALNKIRGVRAVPLWHPHIAEFAKKHNNANVVTFSADLQDLEEALKLLDIFLKSTFEGGRHSRRIEKISLLESEKE